MYMKKRVRKRMKWKRVFFTLFLAISFIGGSVCLYYYFVSSDNELKKDNRVDEQLDGELDEFQDKDTSLSLVMVGDSLIHDKIYNEALKYGNGEYYDFKPMLSLIKPIVSEYDLAYYNQETILGGSEIGVSSYPSFNSPYEVGDAMVDAGFNLISLATNHTLDRGEKAIVNSRNYWDSRKDVLAVGSYTSIEDRERIRVMKKNDITYTMLNYTYGMNGIKVPGGKEYLVNVWPVALDNPDIDSGYQNYKEQVREDIEAVRDKVDVLLVAMHWGMEYEYQPNAYQRDMALYLSSLGVDIIIGTHPHVIQPVTWIDDTLVIYSLGNFISAHEVVNMGNRIGLMSSVEITKTLNGDRTSNIQIHNLENELLYTYYTNDYQDILVVPFSSMEEKYLSNYQEIYDQYKNIVQSIDQNIEVLPLG